MTGILRFFGFLNAAIWFGGSIFFTFVAGTMPFSGEMRRLLGPDYFPYFSGAIAQIGVARFFTFQLVCCVLALAHLAAEWLYQPRRGRRLLLNLLLVIFAFTLLGNYWLLPKMRRLHAIKYATNYPVAQRQAAERSFKLWHAASQVVNVFVLGGLVVYVLRMSQPPEAARFVRQPQFRG
jgi:hypothetical protein